MNTRREEILKGLIKQAAIRAQIEYAIDKSDLLKSLNYEMDANDMYKIAEKVVGSFSKEKDFKFLVEEYDD